jgi:hypothetical protein
MTRTQVVALVAVLAVIVLSPCPLLVLGAALWFVMPSPARGPGPVGGAAIRPSTPPAQHRPHGDLFRSEGCNPACSYFQIFRVLFLREACLGR